MNMMEQHEDAMKLSFNAKQEREKGNEDTALELYFKAAELESVVADYYRDKPNLEPTRSIIVRSAAFLNLKAGNIEKAEKYIFWGLVNSEHEGVKEQLYEALELTIAFKGLSKKLASGNIDYIYKLRQKSIPYIIEPATPIYSSAVTLEMVSDFTMNFTKSLKAFSKSKYKDYFSDRFNSIEDEELAAEEFQKTVNPIVTGAGFGSFQFTVATDFLSRFGEDEELTRLKSNIVLKYHSEIFTKDFNEETINNFKSGFSGEEIDEIFRPIFNIRATNTNYKIGYYDRDSFKLSYLSRTKSSQKRKLLPIKRLNSDDIGKLESTLVHTRTTQAGSASRSVILKQELKSSSFDYPTKIIEPKNSPPIILNQEIIINVNFNSQAGFNFFYDDLPIESSAIVFIEGLSNFYSAFVFFARDLKNKETKIAQEENYWRILQNLIGNLDYI